MKTSFPEAQRVQMLQDTHHMGILATGFTVEGTKIIDDDTCLTEHDVISESLKLKVSARSASSFKLGAANIPTCNFEIYQSDSALTEQDLTNAEFDLYLTNKLTNSDGSFAMMDDDKIITTSDSYCQLDNEIVINEQYVGMTLTANIIYAYVGGAYESHTITLTPKSTLVRYSDYAPAYYDGWISRATVQISLGNTTVHTAVYYQTQIYQVSKIHLGNFIIKTCDLTTDTTRREVKAFESLTYKWLDKTLTEYESGDSLILGDLLTQLYDASLVDIDLAYTESEYSALNDTRIGDSANQKTYKVTGLPGGGTITATLEQTTLRSTDSFDVFCAVAFDYISKTASGGVQTLLEAGLDALKVLSIFDSEGSTYADWLEVYDVDSTTGLKYLRENLEEIFHTAPSFEWVTTYDRRYAVEATYWRLAGLSYSGRRIVNLTDIIRAGLNLSHATVPLYLTDMAVFTIDDEDYFKESDSHYVSYKWLNEDDVHQRTADIKVMGIERTATVTTGNVHLEPNYSLDTDGSDEGEIIATYWIPVETFAEWYEQKILIPDLQAQGIMDEDGTLYHEGDEEGYTNLVNAITAELWYLHNTYFPTATYHDYDCIVLDLVCGDTSGEAYIDVNLIHEAVFRAGQWSDTEKIVEYVSEAERDPETGFIYYDEDKEIESYSIRAYTNEPLANLMMKAKTSGYFTYRQVLSAYAEMKGGLYDAINHRLVTYGGAVYPEDTLYPSDSLYPGDVDTNIGNVIIYDLRLFPANDLYPEDDLYPSDGDDMGITFDDGYTVRLLRELTKYRYDKPIRYYAVRADTVDGVRAEYVFDEDSTDGEVYELSNIITKNFVFYDDYILYGGVSGSFYEEDILSLEAKIVAMPWVEIGDYITLEYLGETSTIRLYEKQLSGIQAAYDTIQQKVDI